MRYFPNNLYAVPQYVAGITFYPMGLFFGYYLNLFYLNHGTQQLLIEVAMWPICAGVLAAGVTAFIQVAIKITFKKYVYEHFYLLMIGLFSIFVGGIIISNNKTHVASSLYVCFIGHGICYVATLSYINIRTAKSEKRFLKISLSGFAYLTGIAVGSHSTITKVKQEIDPLNEYEEVNDVIGSQITLTASFILVGYYVNEVLYWINSYDYKSSLDPDINRENSAKTLFLNKYFCVKHDNDDDGTTTTNSRYEAKFPVKRKARAFFFIYSNIIPVAYFYFPFIYFNNYTLGLNANYNFHVIYWFGVLGCSLSLVMQYFFTNRVIYFLTIVIKLIAFALLLLFLQILERDTHEIILYMLFCALGFHYQANEVNILSYGCLKYIEIEIFVSYMVQYIVIGIIQYWAIVVPEDFLNFDHDIMLPFYHSLIFMGLFLVAIFLGAHVIPKGKQISLLEIKNIINHQLPPMTVARVLPSAPHLHQVYPHDNQQCFHPSMMLQHYPRVGFHHENSQPYANNANQIVLIPAICAGQKW